MDRYSASEELPLLDQPVPIAETSALLSEIRTGRGDDVVQLAGSMICRELVATADAIRAGIQPVCVLHALLLDDELSVGAICSAADLSPEAVVSSLNSLVALGLVVRADGDDEVLPRFSLRADRLQQY